MGIVAQYFFINTGSFFIDKRIYDLAFVFRCQYPAGEVAVQPWQNHHYAALSARDQGSGRGSNQCTAKPADYAA